MLTKRFLALLLCFPLITGLFAVCTDWYLVTYDPWRGWILISEYLYTTCLGNEQPTFDMNGTGSFSDIDCSQRTVIGNASTYVASGTPLPDVIGITSRDNSGWKPTMGLEGGGPTTLYIENEQSTSFGVKSTKMVHSTYIGTLASKSIAGALVMKGELTYYYHVFDYSKAHRFNEPICWDGL